MKIASVAIATLALAACGGGGGPAPMIASAPAIIAPAPPEDTAKEEATSPAPEDTSAPRAQPAEDRPPRPKRAAPAPVVRAPVPAQAVSDSAPAPVDDTDWLEAGLWEAIPTGAALHETHLRELPGAFVHWNWRDQAFAIGASHPHTTTARAMLPDELRYEGEAYAAQRGDTTPTTGAFTATLTHSTLAFDFDFDGHSRYEPREADANMLFVHVGEDWKWDHGRAFPDHGGFHGAAAEWLLGAVAYSNAAAGERVDVAYVGERTDMP